MSDDPTIDDQSHEQPERPAKDDPHRIDRQVNAIGAAGQSADTMVSQPVSGMPAGGPHSLGKDAHDAIEPKERATRRAQDDDDA